MEQENPDISKIMVEQCGQRIGDYLMRRHGNIRQAALNIHYSPTTLNGVVKNSKMGVSSLLLSKIVLDDTNVDLNYFFTGKHRTDTQSASTYMASEPTTEYTAMPLILANTIKELSGVIKEFSQANPMKELSVVLKELTEVQRTKSKP